MMIDCFAVSRDRALVNITVFCNVERLEGIK
jgi:hypothetical protein